MTKIQSRFQCVCIITTVVVAIFSAPLFAAEQVKPLSFWLKKAQQQDDWLTQSQWQEKALVAQSEGVNALPDPRVGISIANMPLDSLSLDQEAMTQIKVSASQQFPRGDSVALTAQKLQQEAGKQPILRRLRQKEVTRDFTLRFIAATSAKQSENLIAKNQDLFSQLAHTVESDYAVTSKSTSQYDVLSAQVMLADIQDRVEQLHIDADNALFAMLSYLDPTNDATPLRQTLENTASEWLHSYATLALNQASETNNQTLLATLSSHPKIQGIVQAMGVNNVESQLVEASFEPQWGVETSYAHRQDANSVSRPDFFSVGVSVDVPLFSRDTRSPKLLATQAKGEELETQRRLLLKQMLAEYQRLQSQWQGMMQRLARIDTAIIPIREQQADAALNAYTNDTSSFSDVLESRINLLEAQLNRVKLLQQLAQLQAQLHYYLPAPQDNGMGNEESY